MQERTFSASRLQLIVYAGLFTAGVSTAAGFGILGLWIEALLCLAFMALALLGETRSWRGRVAGGAFAGYAFLASWGLLRTIAPPFGLVTIAAALIAWDLHHFGQRLSQVERVEAESALIKAHLRRLLITVGAGVGLAGMALIIRVDFGVGAIMLLGLILALGLTRAVSYLRQQSD
jgi:hypothetical protein